MLDENKKKSTANRFFPRWTDERVRNRTIKWCNQYTSLRKQNSRKFKHFGIALNFIIVLSVCIFSATSTGTLHRDTRKCFFLSEKQLKWIFFDIFPAFGIFFLVIQFYSIVFIASESNIDIQIGNSNGKWSPWTWSYGAVGQKKFLVNENHGNNFCLNCERKILIYERRSRGRHKN